MLPQTVLHSGIPAGADPQLDFTFKNYNHPSSNRIDLIAKQCGESIYIDDQNIILPLTSIIKQPSISIIDLKKSEIKTNTPNNLEKKPKINLKSLNKSIDCQQNKSKHRPLRRNSLKKVRSFSLVTALNFKRTEQEKEAQSGTCKFMISKGGQNQKQKCNGANSGSIQFSSTRKSKKRRCSIIPALIENNQVASKIEKTGQKKNRTKQNHQNIKNDKLLNFNIGSQKKRSSTVINQEAKNRLRSDIINKTNEKVNGSKVFFKKKNNQLFDNSEVREACKNDSILDGVTDLSISSKREDFSVLKPLGKGNFGQVFLVMHKNTGFVCAMKILDKKKMCEEKYVNQIVREIVIQSYISHPNIVPLYGVFDDFTNVYILMEYCPDGHLLDTIIKKRRLEEDEAAQYILGIAKGIQYIQNEKIIHRDIKPENILISYGVAKLADFGWSVYQGKFGGMRQTTSGSPLYYSPQIVQKEAYNEKIDIWAMGVLCYECLIGQVPFKVYTLMNLNRIVEDDFTFPEYVDISQQAKDFVRKCLMKKPEQRWSIDRLLTHQYLSSLNEN